MAAPWPTGPDGLPLPVAVNGQPLWPSEPYRLAYEAGQAQTAAKADRRRPHVRKLVALVIAVLLVAFIARQIYNTVEAPQQAQKDVCQFEQQHNIPDATCP